MFCSKCGREMADNSLFCNQCGQPVSGQAALQPGYPGAQVGVAPSLAPSENSGKAIASLVTGIVGLLLFPIAIAAIILGHMSRSEIRKSNGRLRGDGMATAGLVMGYGAFAVIPFILILAAIAIPNLLRARIAANEAAAVSGVRILNVAEIAYRSRFVNVGFTCSLASLDRGDTPELSADHARLIDSVLASGQKSGYRFELRNCTSSGSRVVTYQIVAYPLVSNQTGVRAFCSDQTGVIRLNAEGSPDDCLTSGPPLQ